MTRNADGHDPLAMILLRQAGVRTPAKAAKVTEESAAQPSALDARRLREHEAALRSVECPKCEGEGGTEETGPVAGTYGLTVSPEVLEVWSEYRPCSFCQGYGSVTPEQIAHHDAHIQSIEF